MTSQNTAPPQAVTVYQELLDSLSDAILGRDLETVRARTHLPFVHRTLDAEIVVETEADLDSGTQGMAQALLAQGVNQLIRLATSAKYLSPDCIEGHHVTHMLSNANRVIPSYSSHVVLHCVDGVWKLAQMHSPLANSTWPLKLLTVPETPLSVLRAPVSMDEVQPAQAEPLALYQSFIEALDRANNTNDLAAYTAKCSFPYTAYHDEAHIRLYGPADVEAFFDTVAKAFERNRADRLERRAERAEFISSNMICGYHTMRMYRDNLVVMGPVYSRMILERQGTEWRLKSVTNSASNPTYSHSDPIQQETLAMIRDLKERQRL